jgi:hypothetical protein
MDKPSLTPGARKKLAVEQRFLQLCEPIPEGFGCWEWLGVVGRKGYGKIRIDQRMVSAHRVSWNLHFGDPGDLWVLHRCDNPTCVNPAHLFLGTHADNMQDMARKGRSTKGRKIAQPRLARKPRL